MRKVREVLRLKHALEKVKMNLKLLTSAQIRAARALIRWTAEDLARETALSVATIRRAELSEDETSMTPANDLAVRRFQSKLGAHPDRGLWNAPYLVDTDQAARLTIRRACSCSNLAGLR